MTKTGNNFSRNVLKLVEQIPKGRVMTYGQIAALSGSPSASRVVGGIAHYGPSNLPWHRVVNKNGGLASGYPGGPAAQKQHLEAEGVGISGEPDNYRVNIEELIWWP